MLCNHMNVFLCNILHREYVQPFPLTAEIKTVGAAAQMSLSQIGKCHLLHQSHAISVVMADRE